jgi:hyperosmotically inducible periplasmic protein
VKGRDYDFQPMLEFVMTFSRLLFFAVAALALFSTYVTVHADDAVSNSAATPAPTAAPTKHQIRHANFQLEKSVRKQLDKTLGNTSGILIVARSGAVTLDGTVTDERQIAVAGQAAKTVPGVLSLRNNLTLRIAGR